MPFNFCVKCGSLGELHSLVSIRTKIEGTFIITERIYYESQLFTYVSDLFTKCLYLKILLLFLLLFKNIFAGKSEKRTAFNSCKQHASSCFICTVWEILVWTSGLNCIKYLNYICQLLGDNFHRTK